MCTVRIPSTLREHCDGQVALRFEALSLGSALAQLEQRYPGCAERIAQPDGRPREFVRIYVNDQPACVCDKPSLHLEADDVVSILPAVVGG